MLYLRVFQKYAVTALLVCWLLGSGLLSSYASYWDNDQESEGLSISSNQDGSHDHPLHQPLDEETNEEETVEETNSKEEIEDSESHPFLHSSYNGYYNIYSFQNSALQLAAQLQNRETIALFVLYHSWKSFLS